jgi:hypothetical protein
MKRLKEEIFALSLECDDGSYDGWVGGAGVPSLDDEEYLSDGWYRAVSASLVFAHLDGVVDLPEHVAARVELMKTLTSSKLRSDVSRKRGLELLVDAYPLFSGTTDELVRRLGIKREEVAETDHAVLEDVALEILHDRHRIHYLLRLTLMLTQAYRRFRLDDLDEIDCDYEEVKSLAGRVHGAWRRRLKGPFMVALPHGPMSTLTRESANLKALVGTGDGTWRGAAAKLKKTDGGQQLALVFDKKLVLKDNSVGDTYMQVPLQGSLDEGLDAVGAITRVLMRQYQQALTSTPKVDQIAWLIDDIPRVVAGMFRVATVDKTLTFTNQGEFVDSLSGLRLTRNIGLDPNQKTSRDRVAAVRAFLESIEISRSVRGENGKQVTWTGPIIQRLADKVEVSAELPDGLGRSKKELGVWRIAPELWRMQDPDGKAASFMLLDDRAFSLSVNSSEPFNVYWTIIQRAYNARRARADEDKFDEDGTFSPTFETLYKWSGMESKSDARNPSRARKRLQEHLDLLVESELIEGYTSAVFEAPTFSLKRDVRKRVSITLPQSLLEYLPAESFHTGKNDFTRGLVGE